MLLRTYRELRTLPTFIERYRYLRIGGVIGDSTFGFQRFLNQTLYTTKRWRKVRDDVILRDNGCDLGILDRRIDDCIIVHHMNAITIEDIQNGNEDVFNPEYLICTSLDTHNAIHYGDERLLARDPIERTAGDTCLWKRGVAGLCLP